MDFYGSIEGYQFIAIFPEDFKEEGFSRLIALLIKAHLQVSINRMTDTEHLKKGAT